MLKKQLGAFFTPDKYVKIATKMVRQAIAQVSKNNDYIILDRCAGTGNLQKFLTQEELAHCVLNTYDYTEWTTLKGLYEDRVKMIIPPTSEQRTEKGLLKNGNALSENFINYRPLNNLINDPKITVILLENPPFRDQTSNLYGKHDENVKSKSYVKDKMKGYGSQSNDLLTQFIWSGVKYYCKKPDDQFILFAPIKYWKTGYHKHRIIKMKFVNGYLCNRKYFNAGEAGISLIHWINWPSEYQQLSLINAEKPSENIIVKKLTFPIKKLGTFNETSDIWAKLVIQNPINQVGAMLYNDISKKYNVTTFLIDKKNILNNLVLFVSNFYLLSDFTEKEVIMKSGDGGLKYQEGQEFLKSCFLWSCLSSTNQSLSNHDLTNPFALKQNSKADQILATLNLDNDDKKLLELWSAILFKIKTTQEYNSTYKYGLRQIKKEINIKIPSDSIRKTGELIMKPKYDKLDEMINKFDEKLKEYFKQKINLKLFQYQLLK